MRGVVRGGLCGAQPAWQRVTLDEPEAGERAEHWQQERLHLVRVRVRIRVRVRVRVRARVMVGVRQQDRLHREEQRLYIVAEQRGRRVGGEQPQRVVRGGAKGVAVEGDEDVGVARDELEALLEAPETAARAPDRHLVRVRVRVRVRVGAGVRVGLP